MHFVLKQENIAWSKTYWK